jgi:hypothetical protein
MSAKKLMLNITAMETDFFTDAALIGIASSLPVYRLCWMLNRRFDVNFVRKPDMDVYLQKKPQQEHFFSIYQYCVPLSGTRYLLYKLRSDLVPLMPEIRQLDYVWMIQSGNAEQEAAVITRHLRSLPEVQMAQVLEPSKLKSLNHLLI